MGRAAHSAAAKDGEPLRDERGPGWVGIELVVLREAPGYVTCGFGAADTALTNAFKRAAGGLHEVRPLAARAGDAGRKT